MKAKDKHRGPSAKDVRDRFDYNPLTGKLTWRVGAKRGERKAGDEVGWIESTGYRVTEIDSIHFKIHRIIFLHVTGKWPSNQLDHINGVKLDNRWSNLREVTPSQNTRNSKVRKDNRCGFKGVSYRSDSGKWRAMIWVNGQRVRLGTFETAEEAAAAYNKMAEEHHGEYRRIG